MTNTLVIDKYHLERAGERELINTAVVEIVYDSFSTRYIEPIHHKHHDEANSVAMWPFGSR
ncbi:MAG TPA: hypothetical protein VE844_07090, partial [Gammaproteobacteria bacterium]|nr:hypothetical protein [Gammaproteobacteria bacterium]